MKKLLFLLLCSLQFTLSAQIQLPYYNFFDKSTDTIGWHHNSSSGIDDWQWGSSSNGIPFYAPFSFPYGWATNIDSLSKTNSNRALITPFFDLSNANKHYRLMFKNKRQSYYGRGNYYVEYSVGKDTSWTLLYNSSAKQLNWQNTNGFSYTTNSVFQDAATTLDFIGNADSVQFRFRYKTTSPVLHGWYIDDFIIEEDLLNVSALQGDTIYSSTKCQLTTLYTTIGISNPFNEKFMVETKIYWSKDKKNDGQDSLLKELSTYVTVSTSRDKKIDLDMPEQIDSGVYYLLYTHIISSGEKEYTNLDNESFAAVIINPVRNLPVGESFEDDAAGWYVTTVSRKPSKIWMAGKGFMHHTEGTHSGKKAWHCNESMYLPWDGNGEYLWSPNYDLTTDSQDLVLNVWFKSYEGGCVVGAKVDCEKYSRNLGSLRLPKDDDWDYRNFDLSQFKDKTNAQFSFYFINPGSGDRNAIIDDFYVGSARPDLSIERNKERFTPAQEDSIDLKYYITNCGLKPANSFEISFYWSNTGLFDGSEIFLDSETSSIPMDSSEWRNIRLNKLNKSDDFFIIYRLDSANKVEEMRENNNHGLFKIYQHASFKGEYANDFEKDTLYWRHNASLGNDDWHASSPKIAFADWSFAKKRAWITNSDSLLSDMSRMHLFTPTFDLHDMTTSVLEFDMIKQSGRFLDEASINLSYSVDGGATWDVLDTTSQSFNRWYYPIEYDDGIDRDHFANYSKLLQDLRENVFPGITEYNSRDVLINHHYVLDISKIDRTRIQFRFNLATKTKNKYGSSNPFFRPNERVMIDNFMISESTVDLNIRWKNELNLSTSTDSFDVTAHIWNDGNFLSPGSSIAFYISSDTLLSEDDSLVAKPKLPNIRPGFGHYLKARCHLQNQYQNEQFLIYEIDGNQVIKESNELNNVGYWPLHFYGINKFPYTQDFSDTILNGWNTYSIHNWGYPERGNLRVRNKRVPAEYTNKFHFFESNTLFIERYQTSSGPEPAFIIETPSFDFSKDSNQILSFDLFCTGISGKFGNGGNFEYSLDDGSTWNVVTSKTSGSKNWYGKDLLKGLNNEPGWYSSWGLESDALDLVRTWLDLSFLNGEYNVKFRFKYLSDNPDMGSTRRYGMQIDNFRIGHEAPDLFLTKTMSIDVPFLSDSMTLAYTIENIGNGDAVETKSKIYLSFDQQLDSNDVLVASPTISTISAGQRFTDSVKFAISVDACRDSFFLFMCVDDEDELIEFSEQNNCTWTKVKILPGWNLTAVQEQDSVTLGRFFSFYKYVHRINNVSNAELSPTSTRYYWSDNENLDSSDILLGSQSVPVIGACDSLFVTFKLKIPKTNSQQIHYLIYTIDALDKVIEMDEQDNVGLTKFIFKEVLGIGKNYLLDGVRVFSIGSEIIVHSDGVLTNLKLKVHTVDGKLIDEVIFHSLQPNAEIRLKPSVTYPSVVFVYLIADEGIMIGKAVLSH